MTADSRSPVYRAVGYWLPIHTKSICRSRISHVDLDHSPKRDTLGGPIKRRSPAHRRQRGEAARTTAPVKAASCNAFLSLYLRLLAWPSVATPTAKRSHHGMDNASSN
jgi:hypothetical protein